MANYYEQIAIKTATEGTHKRTMAASHTTSADFGQYNILRAKLLEIGKGTIIPWTYSNMEPLPQPTFGEVMYENRIFTVPCRTIFKPYEDYRQDNIHVTADDTSANIGILPHCNGGDIIRAICDCATNITTATTTSWRCLDGTGTTMHYEDTDLSYWAKKFLRQLGYSWIWDMRNTTPKNLLRLLAAAKVYSDWFYNKAYRGDNEDLAIRQKFERDNGNVTYTWTDIKEILVFCHNVFYEMDYFTAAWDNPNHPNIANQESKYRLIDPNGYSGNNNRIPDVTNNSSQNGDPYLGNVDPGNSQTTVYGITEWAINTLRTLSQFLKRNQLAGGDTLMRFLARYGKENLALKMNRSRLIGTVKWGMNVNPIFSNADTATSGGERLGAYAGQASGVSGQKGQHRFDFELSEDAILIETLVVRPIETYTQGEDRENLILTKTELLTPEFDNVGVDMILKAEIINPEEEGNNTDGVQIYQEGFGWLPRYAYWKTMRDMVTGNMQDPHWAAIYKPYTMQRYIDPDTQPTWIVHSKDFTLSDDAKQFDRIFYSNGAKVPFDNFNIYHEDILEWFSYAKPLYDNYDWEHEGGKEIVVPNQGNSY